MNSLIPYDNLMPLAVVQLIEAYVTSEITDADIDKAVFAAKYIFRGHGGYAAASSIKVKEYLAAFEERNLSPLFEGFGHDPKKATYWKGNVHLVAFESYSFRAGRKPKMTEYSTTLVFKDVMNPEDLGLNGQFQIPFYWIVLHPVQLCKSSISLLEAETHRKDSSESRMVNPQVLNFDAQEPEDALKDKT